MIKNKKLIIDTNDSYTIINGMKQYGKPRLIQVLSDGTERIVAESWTVGDLMQIKSMVEMGEYNRGV